MATAKKAAKTHIGLDSKQSAKLAEALERAVGELSGIVYERARLSLEYCRSAVL